MSLAASPKPSSERSAARAARASKIRDDLWAEACRREEALRDLTRLHPGRFPEIAAPEACFALGASRAAHFRLIARFKTEKTVSALQAWLHQVGAPSEPDSLNWTCESTPCDETTNSKLPPPRRRQANIALPDPSVCPDRSHEGGCRRRR